nr:uncharacterized protein LOC113816312 [Penaeus vannamei]
MCQYVFIGVDVTTNYYIRGLPPELACRVKELQGRYLTGGIAIGLQHNSPFRKFFDNSLQKFRETGLMNKLIQRWLSAERTCNIGTIVSAGIVDVATLFILLVLGIGLSVVFVVGEIGVREIRRKRIGLKRVDSCPTPLRAHFSPNVR